MLYVPRHLSNKLEYKVLSCMSVHYQSRTGGFSIEKTYKGHSKWRGLETFLPLNVHLCSVLA